jgi:hypothetical protein
MDVLPADIKRLIMEFNDEYALERQSLLQEYKSYFNPHVMKLILPLFS